ncbi:tetrapyrrole methylase [Cristinia sonorae]|uniref:Tetrapyrrole methylase n=1 Tax=Cristinia sonorae TaxID=1940300 RepID=A0A8K0UUZ3_9AGAR|nr:tetrapyrrole methylase [Cristinia sonorae]
MAATQPAGSLTIVGTGIESINQITLQALTHIEHANKVFYCVVDPATEAFILGKNKDCVDLYQYYDNGKGRMDTYVQMAELMLAEVRKGLDVVGVFYGHPGVFVNPSHRALAIAREEGYKARMLPGVSAEDCLYADLCIDPAFPGCFTYEASDFLIRERPVLSNSHFVLFQVGCVGIADFNFKGFENNKFNVLVDRLEKEYGADHPVIHYVAAMMPHQDPVMDKWTVGQLRDSQIASQVTGISTFYIPPKTRAPANELIVESLGLLPIGMTADKLTQIYPPSRWESNVPTLPAYGPAEKEIIAKIATHTVPDNYQPLDTSKAMVEVMTRLALDPTVLTKYKADPAAFAQSLPDLSDKERAALTSAGTWAICSAMKRVPESLLAERKLSQPGKHGAPIVAVVAIVGVIGLVASIASAV